MASHGSVDGILNVDKPSGMTSHDVVAVIRKMARLRKVGHAGTLDPLATGVLLVCLGRATRASEYLMRSPKTYRATLQLGIATTTHDAEGEITSRSPVDVTKSEVETVLQRFVGAIQQVPPRYSAIKHHGRPLYELARRGIEVEVPPREVVIHALEIVAWAPPQVTVDVRCGPGTYVRALARDVGEALGCGAHVSALRRTSSGAFDVSEAVDLEALRTAFAAGHVDEHLHAVEAAFYQLPVLCLDADQARRLAMGQYLEDAVELEEESLVRAHGPDGQFIALATRDERSGAWRPHKVFVRPEEIAS